jgi:hypothetical protein
VVDRAILANLKHAKQEMEKIKEELEKQNQISLAHQLDRAIAMVENACDPLTERLMSGEGRTGEES